MREQLSIDLADLERLTSDAVIQRGVAYFRDSRVIELGWDDFKLWATVEGAERDLYYGLEVWSEGEELVAECSCPFEWEPLCKHVVAALLAYDSRQEIPHAALATAEEVARAERKQKARTEVRVEHVAGDPWLGSWRARSVRPTGVPRSWRVDVVGLEDRGHHCECPDFASNRLATCKHIEAVLHALRRRRKFAGARRQASEAPQRTVVHVGWEEAHAEPQVVVRRSARMEPEVAARVDGCFDAAGRLTAGPSALFSIRDALAGRDDVHITLGALELAERALAAASRERDAAAIEAALITAGGRMPGLAVPLYPYQSAGVAFLAARGRALLADDMGLGKTLQAIGAALWLRQRDGMERAVVVCPASLKGQWAREIDRFTGLDTVVVQGPPAERRAQYRQRATFTIINYELVLRDHSVIQSELTPDLLVLDEAQRIKNWRTRTADAVKQLDTRFAFVLSGTPLENRLEDLYSLMQVIDRHVLGPLWHFMVRFHVTDDRGRVLGGRNLSELRRLMGPVMLRRGLGVVADQLPERIVQRVDVALNARQRELHAGAMMNAGRLAQVAKRRPLTPAETKQLMAALQSARMACDAAQLVDPAAPWRSPKLDELERLLHELCVEGDQKVVVFSQWERMTALAAQVVQGLGLGFERLHGGVPSSQRGALLDRFRDQPECRVFLSTDAGSTGLNLQHASALINLDIPWNPAVLEQRIGRIHRLGQARTSHVMLLVAADSYEEQVLAILESKRALFDTVLDPDATDDVAGVSQRNLEAALAALELHQPNVEAEGQSQHSGPAVPTGASPDAKVDEEVEVATARPPDAEGAAAAARIARVIEELQDTLGSRLERVLARAGSLMAVVSRAEGGDAGLGQRLSTAQVPVAVLDRETLAAISRVGLLDAGHAEVAWHRPTVAAPAFADLANRKLGGARALHEAGCHGEALALAAEALRAALAQRARLDEIPSVEELPALLYVGPGASDRGQREGAALALQADAMGRMAVASAGVTAGLLAEAAAFIAGV